MVGWISKDLAVLGRARSRFGDKQGLRDFSNLLPNGSFACPQRCPHFIKAPAWVMCAMGTFSRYGTKKKVPAVLSIPQEKNEESPIYIVH